MVEPRLRISLLMLLLSLQSSARSWVAMRVNSSVRALRVCSAVGESAARSVRAGSTQEQATPDRWRFRDLFLLFSHYFSDGVGQQLVVVDFFFFIALLFLFLYFVDSAFLFRRARFSTRRIYYVVVVY